VGGNLFPVTTPTRDIGTLADISFFSFCEELLKKYGVKWKTQYRFVPHVTVEDGKFRKEIKFTHLGWDLTSAN
jgi:hypothetical protein